MRSRGSPPSWMTSDLELVYQHDELAELDTAARRLALRDLLASTGADDVAERVARLADEIDGFGPLSELMNDPAVTDILVNAPDDIWVERSGSFERTSCSFDSFDHLRTWCEYHVTSAGERVDTSHPIANVRLPEGSRLHVVLPPIAPRGPLVSIRRFPDVAFSLDDLRDAGTMTSEQHDLLSAAVSDKRSIVISGATGCGKTTLLNALLDLVPSAERVVVIEELPELRFVGGNRVSLVAREPNAEGVGAIGLEQLVRASLRMRPDRIVVGEVRGPEALPALWAMRTGHSGTMLSVHASAASAAGERLAELALMAERAPSLETIVTDVRSAVDLFVHLARPDGRRVVTEIVAR